MKIPTLDDLAKVAAAAHKIGSDIDKLTADIENADTKVKKAVVVGTARLAHLRDEAVIRLTSLMNLFKDEK